jgi:hypothetical protein
MTVTKRVARRVGVLAGGVCVASALTLAPANAEGLLIDQDVTCHVFEQVEGPPATAHIRWYTAGGSNGCSAYIYRSYGGVGDWEQIEGRTINTTGTDSSYWYADGAGYHAYVLVVDRNGVLVDGRLY